MITEYVGPQLWSRDDTPQGLFALASACQQQHLFDFGASHFGQDADLAKQGKEFQQRLLDANQQSGVK